MEPTTPKQWQEAADAAVFSIGLDSAWKYGLIAPDPVVDVERCLAIIEEARKRGMVIRTLEEVLAGAR